jgi:membrane protease YdiL (CAAX protease family)
VASTTTDPRGRAFAGGFAAMARAHPLGVFLGVTFAVTWAYELVVFGVFELEFIPWAIPATFVPALAAVVVTRSLEGKAAVRALLRRIVQWRGIGARWWLFGLVVLPAIVLAGYAFHPDPKQNVDDPAAVVALAYVSSLVILTLMGGGQEEPGWRGFALPRMQERFGALKASVLLGLIWGVWHLPLYAFVVDYNNADAGFVNVAGMFLAFTCLYTVGLSVMLAWLYNNAGGSLLLAMLAHGSANAATNFAPETAWPMVFIFGTVWVAAMVVVVATHGRLGYGSTAAGRPSRSARPKPGMRISPMS